MPATGLLRGRAYSEGTWSRQQGHNPGKINPVKWKAQVPASGNPCSNRQACKHGI